MTVAPKIPTNSLGSIELESEGLAQYSINLVDIFDTHSHD